MQPTNEKESSDRIFDIERMTAEPLEKMINDFFRKITADTKQ